MSSKKKKKAKRERRILIAALLVAAVTVAGSTFAWFTSTDDVTNRLTASADYGVSIVESFTPPENWVPGQTINKDVYAVNTGNIDAFVEEEVSALMTYSYEKLVTGFDVTTGVTYEPLGLKAEDEAKSKQAGGYLIWNNADVPNGPIAEDWVPTKSGDYIFRRAIDNNHNNGGTDVSKEWYSLEGYHFDATGVDYDNDPTTDPEHYFKIMIGGNENAVDGNNVVIGNRKFVEMNDEGTALKVAPTISYYTISQDIAKPVSLTYKTDDSGKYLEAVYKANAAQSGTDAYAANTDLAQTIVNNANIVALYEGREALKNLGNAQITAINAVRSAAISVKNAAEAYAMAYEAVTESSTGSQAEAASAGAAVYNKTDTTQYSSLLQDPPGHGSEVGKVSILTNEDIQNSTLTPGAQAQVKQAVTNYKTAEETLTSAKTALGNAIVALHSTDIQGGTAKKADVSALQSTFDDAATAYYQAAEALKSAYANIVTQTQGSALLTSDVTSESMNTLNALVHTAKKMNAGEATGNYRTDLDALIATYLSKAGTNETNDSTMKDKYDLYKQACDNYISAKDSASSAYSEALDTFNAEKKKSKSTDDLVATEFDPLVANYVIEITDDATTDPKSQDNVMVGASDTYNATTSYEKAERAKTYVTAEITKEAHAPSLTGAHPDYTSGQIADENYRGTVSELETGLTNGQASYDSAKNQLSAYDNNVITNAANAEHSIKVKIRLDSKVNADSDATWTMVPVANGEQVAHFYLNKVLAAGVTSDKLIDSVELDGESTTPASFKDMTFDLNVALKSAQVTYNENNQIQTTAASSVFTHASAEVNQTTKAVTWTPTAATPTTTP